MKYLISYNIISETPILGDYVLIDDIIICEYTKNSTYEEKIQKIEFCIIPQNQYKDSEPVLYDEKSLTDVIRYENDYNSWLKEFENFSKKYPIIKVNKKYNKYISSHLNRIIDDDNIMILCKICNKTNLLNQNCNELKNNICNLKREYLKKHNNKYREEINKIINLIIQYKTLVDENKNNDETINEINILYRQFYALVKESFNVLDVEYLLTILSKINSNCSLLYENNQYAFVENNQIYFNNYTKNFIIMKEYWKHNIKEALELYLNSKY